MAASHELPNLDALMERALELATERAIAGAAPFAALVVDANGLVKFLRL